MKQMEVTILGQSYLLGCPEGGEAALLAAVATVDHEMSAIRNGGKVKARERIAVLAALNLAYSLAERPEQATSTNATTATRASGEVAGDAFADTGSVDLDALIQRLDQALSSDNPPR